MTLTALTTLAATEAGGSAGITPYLVGGLAFAILALMLVALLAFGKGREHS